MSMRTLPPGVEVIKTDAIPEDNADHAGQQAVQLRTATGAKAWGFGETDDDAIADALAALAEDLDQSTAIGAEFDLHQDVADLARCDDLLSQHVLIFAPARAGMGVGPILPQALDIFGKPKS